MTSVDNDYLVFIARHEPVSARALFENGPAPSLKAAQAAVRRLRRCGLIERSETDRGGFAGWVRTTEGEGRAALAGGAS